MPKDLKKCEVVALIGQTASGKTSTAIKLAREINGEIISADSRQVYTGLDIGSDKVTAEQMQGVPHHLLSIANPLTETYTVSSFIQDATESIEDICNRGKVPIVAGGTMLYIDALFGNVLVPEVPPNPRLRSELEQRGSVSLFAELQSKDPRRAKQMIVEGQNSNKRRLIRALEVVEQLGRVPKVDDLSAVESSYNILWLGLTNEPKLQKEKINKRNSEMLDGGLLEEVSKLQKSGITQEQFNTFGFEYKYPSMYLSGIPIIQDEDPTLEQVLMKMNSSTWRYAKKQRAWWNKRENIKWFMPDEYNSLKNSVRKFLSKKY